MSIYRGISYMLCFGGELMGDRNTQRFLSVVLILSGIFNFKVVFAAAEFNVESVFQSNTQVAQNHLYAQTLLKQLGFTDYVAKIEATLRSSEKISDVSKLALEKSKIMLTSINASR